MARFEITSDQAVRLKEICRSHRVRKLTLFGSAVDGRFIDEQSDLDFVVDMDFSSSGAGASNQFYSLLSELEILFSRPVDLVSRNAIQNPYFKEEISETEELLYAA